MSNNTEVEGIETMLDNIDARYEHYTTLHDAYMKEMQNSGGYEVVEDYAQSPGDIITPAIVLQLIADGTMQKKGIERAKDSGKIRLITAVKPEALTLSESEMQGMVQDFKTACDSLVSKYQVVKTRGKTSRGDGEYAEVKDAYLNPLKTLVQTKYPDAVFILQGRQLTGTTSKGVELFSFNVYGQNKLGENNIKAWVRSH